MRGERGQVTIFVILALVIIVVGVLVYAFLPGIKSTVSLDSKNPNAYLQDCLEDDVEEAVEMLALQGGSQNPSNYYAYDGNNIEYLCYTSEDRKLCNVQKPLIYSSFEKELEKELETEIDSCFEALRNDFDKKGYQVNLRKEGYSVEILPEKILLNLNYELDLSKGSVEKYDSFSIFLDNNIYQLLGIAKSIVDRESNFGEAPTEAYMMLYRDLKVEKLKQSDETKIYIITNKKTGEVFQFASRSLAASQGII
ncbi:MAG: hypothetical protein U9Q99_02200 [Nanoarchaeota archaeon]|nr:hypothetical protein [Nanoarchaeota archaeon]